MDPISPDELKGLAGRQTPPCVSLYMPTHKYGREIMQGPIRLKDLMRVAEEKLTGKGQRPPDVREFLRPARDLSEVPEEAFWRFQDAGLALFLAPGLFRFYRLPLSFAEEVFVSDSFYLKPLLRLFAGTGDFRVLAVSENNIRLLSCSRFTMERVDLHGLEMPHDFKEVLGNYDLEKEQLFRSREPRSRGSRTHSPFGHGMGVDDMEDKLLQYLSGIDKGLHVLLRKSKEPLVVAGVDYLLPLYRQANTYEYLMKRGIEGNPDRTGDEELHAKAWEIVGPYFHKEQEEAARKFMDSVGTGHASGNMEQIVTAAYDGLVDFLFVAEGLRQWGTFEPSTRQVTVHSGEGPGDMDLLGFAAVHAFLNRGKVYEVLPEEVPGGGPAAAFFRF